MNLFFNITSVMADALPQAVFPFIYTIFEKFCRLISKLCFCCMFCFISAIETNSFQMFFELTDFEFFEKGNFERILMGIAATSTL